MPIVTTVLTLSKFSITEMLIVNLTLSFLFKLGNLLFIYSINTIPRFYKHHLDLGFICVLIWVLELYDR